RPFLDLNEWTDKTVIPDRAAIKINRLNNGYIVAEDHVNNSGCAKLWCVHEDFASQPLWPKGVARSKIDTTVRAWAVPVSGFWPERIQSRKCSASTRRGSVNFTSGKSTSPLR